MAVLDQSGWYTVWCEPIVVALYQRDSIGITKYLAAAQEALRSGEIEGEDAACLRYQLIYLDFQARLALKDPGWVAEMLPDLAARLSERSDYEQAEGLRRRLYLQLRINLDRIGVQELSPTEFDLLFAELPKHERNTEAWLYISGWAFLHEQVEYLQQAYEFALLQARGFSESWTWQRVHLMWKLVRGDASREDISWLISQAEMPQELHSIRNIIWPRARDMGLVDERLELRFRERELELGDESARVTEVLRPHLVNPTGTSS